MDVQTAQIRELAVMISVAYLKAQPVAADRLPGMIRDTFAALSTCAQPAPAEPEPRTRDARGARRQGREERAPAKRGRPPARR